MDYKVVLTWSRTWWFRANADRLARIVDERLREIVVAEFMLDLLADFVSLASHLLTKRMLSVMTGEIRV